MKIKLEHIFNWNNFFSTLLVIAILKYLPILFSIDMLDPIQNTFQDMQLTDLVFSQVRDNEEVKIDKNIVLVNNGHLDRKTTAELLNIINSNNPKIIAIDAFFRNPKGEEQDLPLADAFSNIKNLILVNELFDTNDDSKFDSLKTSNPMFNKFAVNGYANMYIHPEDFKTVRLVKPISKVNNKYIPSLSSKVVQIYDNAKYKRYKNRNNELEAINFKRNINKYYTYNYDDILNGNFEPNHFTNKIVLIGYMGPKLGELSTEDIFYTPMNDHYVGKTTPDMYGVVIHANIISMILDEDYIYRTSDIFSLILMILVVYCNMILFNYWRKNDELVLWYQPFTIILIFGELIGFSLLMIFLMSWFSIELRFAASFFAILVSVLSFELFTDSIRPLVVGVFRRRELKKNMQTNKSKNNDESDEIINVSDEIINVSDEIVNVSDEIVNVSDEIVNVSDEIVNVSDEIVNVSDEIVNVNVINQKEINIKKINDLENEENNNDFEDNKIEMENFDIDENQNDSEDCENLNEEDSDAK